MALPADIDHRAVMVCALDRIKKEKCERQDPSDFKYIPPDSNRMYRCPVGLSRCERGNCRVVSEQKCNDSSQIPCNPATGKEQSCDKTHPCPNGTRGPNKTRTPTKPYLEFPDQRGVPSIKGVADVPPFSNQGTGVCGITRKWMGQSYKLDEQNRPTCYPITGQKVREFFVGKTIFRGFKPRSKVAPNFAGESVSLYMNNNNLAFNFDEIRTAYPELIKGDSIKFTPDDLKHGGKERLYYTLKHSSWLNPTIQKL